MINKKSRLMIALGLLLVVIIGFLMMIIKVGFVAVNNRPAIDVDGYLAENIVYDSMSAKYWWIVSDRKIMGIRLLSSGDLVNWEEGNLIIDNQKADSACIRRFGGVWYVYFAQHFDNSGRRDNIWMCSSRYIDRDYSSPALVLDVSSSINDWDYRRVSEPDIEWRDGRFYLFYMGENQNREERVGYAVSLSPSGPFDKYVNNPVLTGSNAFAWKWNSGRDKAADPYIFSIKEGYIIQHAASRLDKNGWSIGWAFTRDFITFVTLEEPILITGSWAREGISRGGLLETKGKYFISFVGYDGWTMKYGKSGLIEIKNFDDIKKRCIQSQF